MKKQSNDKELKAAVFAAALKATDAEDVKACEADMQKLAEIDEDSARIITAAIRNKQIPVMAQRAGLDEGFIKQLTSPLGESGGAVGFAKKKRNPEEEISEPEGLNGMEDDEEGETSHMEHEESETPEFEEKEDSDFEDVSDDISEDNDGDGLTETIKIEVPADMVDQIKSKLDEFFTQEFGGMEEEGDEFEFPESEGETSFEEDAAPVEEPIEETGGLESEDAGPTNLEQFTRSKEMDKEASAKKKEVVASEKDMSPEELAQRKAYRQELLTRVAASEDNVEPKDIGLGKDTSFNGKPYQYSEKLQHEDEVEYPKMTMESSEGNSLKDDPKFTTIPIPTKNPENLQLSDSYNQFSFSGGDDGSLDFSADFDEMNKVPSAGETATDDKFEIPTQLEQKKRSTTVAKVVTCQGCHNPRNAEVETVECVDCGKRLCLCSECLDKEYCPSCAVGGQKKQAAEPMESEACDYKVSKINKDNTEEVEAQLEPNVPTVEMTPPDKSLGGIEEVTDQVKQVAPKNFNAEMRSNAAVFQARIKTAYAVATQLVLAKVIEQDEVDPQVDLWMNDGLSAKAMKTTGALMLRSAQNSAERVAANAVKATRTASNNSVSTNPSFITGTNTNSVTDLKDALSSIFMERFAE